MSEDLNRKYGNVVCRYIANETIGQHHSDVRDLLSVIASKDRKITELKKNDCMDNEATIKNLTDHNEMLQKLIPPPRCKDCQRDMKLNPGHLFYTCWCHNECSCVLRSPCSYCEVVVDAMEYWSNGKLGDNWDTNPDTPPTAIRKVESGTSAAARAKPVTRFVVGCQSGAWDGLENL